MCTRIISTLTGLVALVISPFVLADSFPGPQGDFVAKWSCIYNDDNLTTQGQDVQVSKNNTGTAITMYDHRLCYDKIPSNNVCIEIKKLQYPNGTVDTIKANINTSKAPPRPTADPFVPTDIQPCRSCNFPDGSNQIIGGLPFGAPAGQEIGILYTCPQIGTEGD